MSTRRRVARGVSAPATGDLWGLALMALALLLLLSLPLPQGRLLDLAHRALLGSMGVFWVPLLVLMGAAGLGLSLGRRVWPPSRRSVAVAAGSVWLACVASGVHAPWGGVVGQAVDRVLLLGVGYGGRVIVWVAGVVALWLLGSEWPFARLLGAIGRGAVAVGRQLVAFLTVEVEEEEPQPEPAPALAPAASPPVTVEVAPPPEAVSPRRERSAVAIPQPLFPREDPPLILDGYTLPPLELLDRPAPGRSRGMDVAQKSALLETTLAQFGVGIRVVGALQGPAVTRFEVQPLPGVKVSRIVSLADDIALAMAATEVRIEAPIPGKAAMGIEVPNGEVAPVVLRDILESSAFREAGSPLTVGLGKDIAGRPIVAALDRMPHLLIAGATGAGKSVCLNAIICSLLFRCPPSMVKLLLIDPKVVELQHFDGIPHLVSPVVTNPKKAAGVLRGVLKEMEDRYQRFAQAGVREIHKYNETVSVEERLPLIVVVIDELADLMMVAPADVEDAICRLAQMARAAGIHLVVATQRPSVDVITGLIKANIPSRIAFAVSSQVDSRTILDGSGAEKLLGKGDMLFAPLGLAKPIRAQGAYVSEREVESLLNFIREQGAPDYQPRLLEAASAEDEGEAQSPADRDARFEEAVRFVMEMGQASTSSLQRRLRIGFSRAGRLMDELYREGVIGAPDGARPREVKWGPAEFERFFGHPLGGYSRPQT